LEIKNPHIIQLPKIADPRGNLSFFENNNQIPFDIARTYWIHDVPGGERRGGHAYKTQEEFIVALSGSFDVVVFDGVTTQTFQLNRSYYGLYIPALFWRELNNFSTNSLALIAVNKFFDSNEYITEKIDFKKIAKLC
jgi:dTDP-4-dehydrorhamnose 3,5-epimerase-like enzyme